MGPPLLPGHWGQVCCGKCLVARQKRRSRQSHDGKRLESWLGAVPMPERKLPIRTCRQAGHGKNGGRGKSCTPFSPAHIMLEVMMPSYADELLHDVRFWFGTLTSCWGHWHHQLPFCQ